MPYQEGTQAASATLYRKENELTRMYQQQNWSLQLLAAKKPKTTPTFVLEETEIGFHRAEISKTH